MNVSRTSLNICRDFMRLIGQESRRCAHRSGFISSLGSGDLIRVRDQYGRGGKCCTSSLCQTSSFPHLTSTTTTTCVRRYSAAQGEQSVTEIRSSIQDHYDASGVVKTKKFVVSYEELVALIDKGPDAVKLVDVREPKEIEETGLIPRAINIPLSTLKSALQLDAEMFISKYGISKPVRDEPVPLVFYARSAVRSSTALEIAYRLGLKKSKHYPGGWDEWSAKKTSPV